MSQHGRGFDQRQHIYTAFSTYDFGVVRADLRYLQPHLTLDYPSAGMVVEVIEPDDGVDRDEVVRRLRDDILPRELSGSAAVAVLSFLPRALKVSTPVPRVASAVGAERNLTLLWFLEADPRACWSMFEAHQERLRAAKGRVVFAAPFIPTIVGTDAYVSELR
jgi:hypothetical protein